MKIQVQTNTDGTWHTIDEYSSPYHYDPKGEAAMKRNAGIVAEREFKKKISSVRVIELRQHCDSEDGLRWYQGYDTLWLNGYWVG